MLVSISSPYERVVEVVREEDRPQREEPGGRGKVMELMRRDHPSKVLGY